MPSSPEEESQSKPMHLVGDLQGAAVEETRTAEEAVESCFFSLEAAWEWGDAGSPRHSAALAFLLPERLYHLVGPERVWEVHRNLHVGVGHRQKITDSGMGTESLQAPRCEDNSAR